MRLTELLHNDRRDWRSIEIKGLAADSRLVKPGFLFAALHGTVLDGSAFLDDALANGATAVLCEPIASIRADLSCDRCVLEPRNPGLVAPAANCHGFDCRLVFLR